jgi:hypothetical protein
MPGAKPSAKTLPFVSLPVSISTSKTRMCDGPPSVKPVSMTYSLFSSSEKDPARWFAS